MKQLALAALVMIALSLSAQQQPGYAFHSTGNPILADGSYYSADPAPVVVGDQLYILAGRDEAPAGVNDFVMNAWQMFATHDVASGNWTHYPGIARPESLFKWAAEGRAYAGQIVAGRDHRYYMYCPVAKANSTTEDPFAIGVAVADSVLGPWSDAHPAGPILSQATPGAEHMQNIDPTVLVDEDGRQYMYWGTFGQLRGIELAADMITPVGPMVNVKSLKGFFEAAWLFKRGSTYYLSYAANHAGAASECTPTLYHACLAYGTSSSPLGPWTYRGVLLGPVSSTTSHEGIIPFKGQWYLVYHTADAQGGGYFRRSVAIDKLEWDDSTQPASIRRVLQTHAPAPPRPASRNVAPAARASASNEPVALQYWLQSINDEKFPDDPLPPQMWATWKHDQIPARAWLQYAWDQPVLLNGARLWFWADHPAGAQEGVAPPAAFHLEYAKGGRWLPVEIVHRDTVRAGKFVAVDFKPIATACLRAVFDASAKNGNVAAVAVEEFEALAPGPVNLPAHSVAGSVCPQ